MPPSVFDSYKDLVKAFHSGCSALEKRKREKGRTKFGQRTVFTKDELCIQSTRNKLFGTFGYIDRSVDAMENMVNFFPEFEKFTICEYTAWKDDDASKDTFTKMEDAAFTALTNDMSSMYNLLKPLIREAMFEVKDTLFTEDGTGTKRKVTEDKLIRSFPSNLQAMIDNIDALRNVCGDAEHFLGMIASVTPIAAENPTRDGDE